MNKINKIKSTITCEILCTYTFFMSPILCGHSNFYNNIWYLHTYVRGDIGYNTSLFFTLNFVKLKRFFLKNNLPSKFSFAYTFSGANAYIISNN